jgi:hypothetical protein
MTTILLLFIWNASFLLPFSLKNISYTKTHASGQNIYNWNIKVTLNFIGMHLKTLSKVQKL